MIYAGEAPAQSTFAAASGITPGATPGITPMFLTRASASRRGEPAPKTKLPAVVVTDAPLAVWGKRQSEAMLPLWDQCPPRHASPSNSGLGAVPQERPNLTGRVPTPTSLRLSTTLPPCEWRDGRPFRPLPDCTPPNQCTNLTGQTDIPHGSRRCAAYTSTRDEKQSAAISDDLNLIARPHYIQQRQEPK